jgi:hypothetical protein
MVKTIQAKGFFNIVLGKPVRPFFILGLFPGKHFVFVGPFHQ